MSYDLMVFDPAAAPKDRQSFMRWYLQQTAWSEDHGYDDPGVASPALGQWFAEMIRVFPPMNGFLAVRTIDAPEVTDYSIGRQVIYGAFAGSVAEAAYHRARVLATRHRVGFYDASGDDGGDFTKVCFFPGR